VATSQLKLGNSSIKRKSEDLKITDSENLIVQVSLSRGGMQQECWMIEGERKFYCVTS
jgi:hypothetical protein